MKAYKFLYFIYTIQFIQSIQSEASMHSPRSKHLDISRKAHYFTQHIYLRWSNHIKVYFDHMSQPQTLNFSNLNFKINFTVLKAQKPPDKSFIRTACSSFLPSSKRRYFTLHHSFPPHSFIFVLVKASTSRSKVYLI